MVFVLKMNTALFMHTHKSQTTQLFWLIIALQDVGRSIISELWTIKIIVMNIHINLHSIIPSTSTGTPVCYSGTDSQVLWLSTGKSSWDSTRKPEKTVCCLTGKGVSIHSPPGRTPVVFHMESWNNINFLMHMLVCIVCPSIYIWTLAIEGFKISPGEWELINSSCLALCMM